MATIDTMGVSREANLTLVEDEVKVSDWVLVHVGIAMAKINAEEALKSLVFYEELLAEEDRQIAEIAVDEEKNSDVNN